MKADTRSINDQKAFSDELRGREDDDDSGIADGDDGGDEEDEGRRILWSQEEDMMLTFLVTVYGCRWSLVASMMHGRSGKSCRLRWRNHLNPRVNKQPFSEWEDAVVLKAHDEYGNKWATISRLLPGRTDNSVKNRWNATLKRRVAEGRVGNKFLDEGYTLQQLLDQTPEQTNTAADAPPAGSLLQKRMILQQLTKMLTGRAIDGSQADLLLSQAMLENGANPDQSDEAFSDMLRTALTHLNPGKNSLLPEKLSKLPGARGPGAAHPLASVLQQLLGGSNGNKSAAAGPPHQDNTNTQSTPSHPGIHPKSTLLGLAQQMVGLDSQTHNQQPSHAGFNASGFGNMFNQTQQQMGMGSGLNGALSNSSFMSSGHSPQINQINQMDTTHMPFMFSHRPLPQIQEDHPGMMPAARAPRPRRHSFSYLPTGAALGGLDASALQQQQLMHLIQRQQQIQAGISNTPSYMTDMLSAAQSNALHSIFATQSTGLDQQQVPGNRDDNWGGASSSELPTVTEASASRSSGPLPGTTTDTLGQTSNPTAMTSTGPCSSPVLAGKRFADEAGAYGVPVPRKVRRYSDSYMLVGRHFDPVDAKVQSVDLGLGYSKEVERLNQEPIELTAEGFRKASMDIESLLQQWSKDPLPVIHDDLPLSNSRMNSLDVLSTLALPQSDIGTSTSQGFPMEWFTENGQGATEETRAAELLASLMPGSNDDSGSVVGRDLNSGADDGFTRSDQHFAAGGATNPDSVIGRGLAMGADSGFTRRSTQPLVSAFQTDTDASMVAAREEPRHSMEDSVPQGLAGETSSDVTGSAEAAELDIQGVDGRELGTALSLISSLELAGISWEELTSSLSGPAAATGAQPVADRLLPTVAEMEEQNPGLSSNNPLDQIPAHLLQAATAASHWSLPGGMEVPNRNPSRVVTSGLPVKAPGAADAGTATAAGSNGAAFQAWAQLPNGTGNGGTPYLYGW